jgi:hypothetical protein
VETAKFDFSVLICTNDSRGRRNVADFSGGPGLEFMPRARLFVARFLASFPRLSDVLRYYFIPHIDLFLPRLTLHTVILPRYIT